jgi:hypothetical protein
MSELIYISVYGDPDTSGDMDDYLKNTIESNLETIENDGNHLEFYVNGNCVTIGDSKMLHIFEVAAILNKMIQMTTSHNKDKIANRD